MSVQQVAWIHGARARTRPPRTENGVSQPSFARTLIVVAVCAVAGGVVAGSVGVAMLADAPLDPGASRIDLVSSLALGVFEILALSMMVVGGALVGTLSVIGLANRRNVSEGGAGVRAAGLGADRSPKRARPAISESGMMERFRR
jgi:hypothetical protein